MNSADVEEPLQEDTADQNFMILPTNSVSREIIFTLNILEGCLEDMPLQKSFLSKTLSAKKSKDERRRSSARHKEEKKGLKTATHYLCRTAGCMKKFSTKESCEQHKTQHHAETKKYPCPVDGCGRLFNCHSSFVYHVNTHVGSRNEMCPVNECQKSFYTNQQLRVHLLSHTGERPFTCTEPDCGKGFTTNQNLQNHVRTHTGEKPFSCKECGRSFAEASSLKKHSLIHEGKKPYACVKCDRVFSQSSSRGVHQRKVHGIVSGATENIDETLILASDCSVQLTEGLDIYIPVQEYNVVAINENAASGQDTNADISRCVPDILAIAHSTEDTQQLSCEEQRSEGEIFEDFYSSSE